MWKWIADGAMWPRRKSCGREFRKTLRSRRPSCRRSQCLRGLPLRRPQVEIIQLARMQSATLAQLALAMRPILMRALAQARPLTRPTSERPTAQRLVASGRCAAIEMRGTAREKLLSQMQSPELRLTGVPVVHRWQARHPVLVIVRCPLEQTDPVQTEGMDRRMPKKLPVHPDHRTHRRLRRLTQLVSPAPLARMAKR